MVEPVVYFGGRVSGWISIHWPGMSSFGTFFDCSDGTENCTWYLPLVGPCASGTLYFPSTTSDAAFVPLGSIAMNRIKPLATGLPLRLTLPSSLPRLGPAGAPEQPATNEMTARSASNV